MKKITLLILLILFKIFAFSQEFADENEIKQIALKYIDSKLAKDDTTQFKIKSIKYQYYNNHKSYSIVDFYPTGHVLMSAYKYFEPVLSYSLEHNFVFEVDNFFLYGYNKIIDSLIIFNIQDEKFLAKWNFYKSEPLERKSTTDVYFITTQWGQTENNEPYDSDFRCGNRADPNYGAFNKFVKVNEDCGCGHCTAGCSSLAMAQIIRYWEYPAYSEKRTYNFNLMPDELVDTSSFEQIDEIAHLIADCGDLSSSIYCISDCLTGSTGNRIKRSLKNNFMFSDNIEKIKMKNYTYEQWYDIIRNEINYNRPTIILGQDQGLTDAHVYICDGYSSSQNNMFHINTGNKTSGWYLIPEDNYYTNRVRMLIKIYPSLMLLDCSSEIDLGVFYTSLFLEPMLAQPWAGTIYSANSSYPEEFRTVYNGDIVNMHAYNSIVLRQGFSVRSGGEFHAYLTDCPEQKNNDTKNVNTQNNTIDLSLPPTLKISPNPTAGKTSISYFLPQKTNFTIELYDIYGKKYKNLEQGTKNSGNYQFYIDISGYENGVYFCVLKTSAGVISRKIIKI